MNDLEQISILFIEDNPGYTRVIKEYLKRSFLEFQPTIKVANTLENGTDRLREEVFDIILLDISLPDSFGLDTFEAIHEEAQTVPIIVLTGLDDEKIGIKAVKFGAQDFLTKKWLTPTLLSRSISYAIQRNRLKTKLEKSEKRLLEAQRLAHLGNFEQDLETGELIWSDELFRIFDMDPKGEEPSFSGFMKMIHPEDRNRVVNTIDKVRKETKPQFLELRVNTHSGRSKHIFNIINPLKNQAGEIVKIFGTTHDITQYKKTENKLKEHEHRYRTLFKAATDEILVFQVDEQMNPLPFLEVNDTACNILGYSRNELLQKIIYDIVAADKEEVDRRIELIIEEQEVVRDSRHKTKEGDIIPLEISSRAFKFNGRHTIVSIGRDIRERLELEQEILNISDYERQRIGHDLHDSLGQMLSGIGLLAQNLVKKSKKNGWPAEKEIQDITDMIREADQQARTLSRGLVPIYLESDGLDAALNELVERASKLYSIDVHYQPGSTNIQEDNTRALHLYRITQEAINNAVKHGKATSIEVELSSFEDQIFLRIQDNGSGFQEPEERSDGMGLRIMHFRSQMIGGNLKINSKKGVGTEITCHIPRAI